MKQIFILLLLLLFYSKLSYSQQISNKIASSGFSNNEINYEVGLSYVNVVYHEKVNNTEIDNNPNSINNPEFNFLYFPNPVTDKLFLQYKNEKEPKLELQIYNELGQLVVKESVSNNYIDLSNFPIGMYLVLTNDKRIKPFKILKN